MPVRIILCEGKKLDALARVTRWGIMTDGGRTAYTVDGLTTVISKFPVMNRKIQSGDRVWAAFEDPYDETDFLLWRVILSGLVNYTLGHVAFSDKKEATLSASQASRVKEYIIDVADTGNYFISHIALASIEARPGFDSDSWLPKRANESDPIILPPLSTPYTMSWPSGPVRF